MSDGVEVAFPIELRGQSLEAVVASLEARFQADDRPSFSQRLTALGRLSDVILERRATLPPAMAAAGLAFLTAFLRTSHLEETLARELPHPLALEQFVSVAHRKSLRLMPRGLVCHWIAGNVPLLGFFSWAVSALLGNVNLLRLSARQDDLLSPLLALLADSSPAGRAMAQETALVFFDRQARSAHELMSQRAQVRIAWGGAEAIDSIRALPAHWECDDIAMGPRVSLAVVDPALASDAVINRLAVDVVYFDQLACSSPQRLFVKGARGTPQVEGFLERFTAAFARQALAFRRHPLDFSETYQIQLDRARVLLAGGELRHDEETQWSVAVVEQPVGRIVCANRFLEVLPFTSWETVLAAIPANVQTVITVLSPPDAEWFSTEAARRGACRFPQPGEGNHFEVPWDGIPLASRLTRWVLRTDA